jgi:hypothetical protein
MITSDVDSIFDRDFAEDITHHYGAESETISAIVRNPYEVMELGGVGLESALPSIAIKTSDNTNIDRSTSYFTIDSVTYHIIEMSIDDYGITIIQLSKDDE